MNYGLPHSVIIEGEAHEVRTDYRAILDICTCMTDPNLSTKEKIQVIMGIFYYDDIPVDYWEEAVNECMKFINLGEESTNERAPKLMDWSQDFQYIVAPINRVAGTEIRSLDYLHWWTFIGYYYEIGECTFSQIVHIRNLKARGKKLDKFDKEWYKEHRSMVDLKVTYSDAENDLFKQWGV